MKLAEYLKIRGSQTDLARAIKAQPQLVWQWSTGVRQVPVARCIAIDRATDGAVTCEELRPDRAEEFAYLRGRPPVWPEMAAAPDVVDSAPVLVPAVEAA